MSKLRDEKNLLKLYLHICGKTQVPSEYYWWSFISLLAALTGDNVSVRKLKGKPVTPDMFIFLIGPSAVGKGTAIDRVVDLSIAANLPIERFQGNLSAAGLQDHMGKDAIGSDNGIWLVTDELANDIGSGRQADTFIKFMTSIYTKCGPYDSRIRGDGKNTGGHLRIEKPLINWLAGTTWEWLIDSVTGKTAVSGFGSRAQPIFARYDLNVRYPEPIYPKDADLVEAFIIARLWDISRKRGEFEKTQEAKDFENQWFMNRKSPEEEIIIPWWIRGHDLALKMAMLHALMLREELVIEKGDIQMGVRWYDWLYKQARKLFDLAVETTETSLINQVEKYLRWKREVKHVTLANAMYKHQIRKKQLDGAIGDLGNRGMVEICKVGGEPGYRWIEFEEE